MHCKFAAFQHTTGSWNSFKNTDDKSAKNRTLWITLNKNVWLSSLVYFTIFQSMNF